MSYIKYLGDKFNNPRIRGEPSEMASTINSLEWDTHPRLGIPSGWISWEEHKADVEKAVKHFLKHGYESRLPRFNIEFAKHLHYFRANLDAYNELVKKPVFCRDEIYFRCLTEGPAFKDFISKSRTYSLIQKIGIRPPPLKDEYVHEEYTGYDSIIHERYLICWDDSETTEDWLYGLIENPEVDHSDLIRGWNRLDAKYLLKEQVTNMCKFTQQVAGKKSSTLDRMKTVLLKDTWTNNIEMSRGWVAVRKVLPTDVGKTRDTGVPDIESLNKLKKLHTNIAKITEKLPYSANCSYTKLNSRIKRLRNARFFTHIDFKKFGLTFPRDGLNRLLRILGLDDLQLVDFVLRTEEGDYFTNRGGVLGWFDQAVSLVVISLIVQLAEQQGWKDFDMLMFNDDVEISWKCSNPDVIRLRQDIICRMLEANGFLISHKKTFSSRESIFLEDYEHFETLEMSKLQLAVRQFAGSMSTPFSWEAKTRWALGSMYGYTATLKHWCFGGLTMLSEDEYSLPLELGGWNLQGRNGLNYALKNATPGQMTFFLAMRKYKEPEILPKESGASVKVIEKRRYQIIANAQQALAPSSDKVELDPPSYLPEAEADSIALESYTYREEVQTYLSEDEYDSEWERTGPDIETPPPLPAR
jgi:hypothetical protein